MNAEDNTASCLKKAITIIRRILVVSVLKTITSHHNISSGWRLLRTKIKLAPVSRVSSNQPSTGLKVISTHRNSPTNWASPPHIIRPLGRKPWERGWPYFTSGERERGREKGEGSMGRFKVGFQQVIACVVVKICNYYFSRQKRFSGD